MLYELRSRFSLQYETNPADIGRADHVFQWLSTALPIGATLGAGVAPYRWLGNRYTVPDEVVYELASYYRDVFGLTADRLRIRQVWDGRPVAYKGIDEELNFDVLRVYDEADLTGVGGTKKLSHPM